ncbi:MAG: hypothetical protein ACYC24_08805 [Desulfobacteria bacterium]
MEKYDRMRIEDGWKFTGEMFARGGFPRLRGHHIKELGEFSKGRGGWRGDPEHNLENESVTVNELLATIAGLKYLGPSSKIKEKISLAREVSTFSREMELAPEAERKEIAKGLHNLDAHLRHLYTRARVAEDLLAMNGLRFNPKTGTAEVRNGRGRPSPFMTRCIVLLYVALKEKYSGKRLEGRIRYLLAHYFPPAVLTLEKISDAIDNFQRKEKMPVDCKRSQRRHNSA